MSVTFAEPTTTVAPEIEVRPSTRTYVRPQPHVAPTPASPRVTGKPKSKPKTATRKASRVASGKTFALRATMFIVVGVSTWSASSLSGQVLAEAARRDGIRAHQRASIAHKALASLQRRVDALTSDESVEAWAKAHGMVALDGFDNSAPKERNGLVAFNP